MNPPEVRRQVVSVPWPIRLFGDLQEALHLPSITAAVDIRTAIVVQPRQEHTFRISGRGLPEPLTLDSEDETACAARVPSFARALRVVAAGKFGLKSGYDFEVHTRVPGIENLMDCPVATVNWVVTLLALGGGLRDLCGEEVARLAAEAVAKEGSVSWGLAETYACILGGMQTLEWAGKPRIAHLERALPGMVLGYSPGSVVRHQGAVLRKTGSAIQRLESIIGETSFAVVSFDEVVPLLRGLSDDDARAVYAHLGIRDYCYEARELVDGEQGLDDDRLGEMLDGAHEMLRDYLGFDQPEIESLIQAAIGAGAIGCKLIPGTATFVAFAPGKDREVINAIVEAGGQARGGEVSDGMRVDG